MAVRASWFSVARRRRTGAARHHVALALARVRRRAGRRGRFARGRLAGGGFAGDWFAGSGGRRAGVQHGVEPEPAHLGGAARLDVAGVGRLFQPDAIQHQNEAGGQLVDVERGAGLCGERAERAVQQAGAVAQETGEMRPQVDDAAGQLPERDVGAHGAVADPVGGEVVQDHDVHAGAGGGEIGGQHGGELGHEALGQQLVGGGQQVVPAGEEVLDEAGGDAGLATDAAQAGAVGAVAGEADQGGFEDLPAALIVAEALAGWSGG